MFPGALLACSEMMPRPPRRTALLLQANAPRAAYLALARLAIPIAEAKGALTPEAAETLRGMLE